MPTDPNDPLSKQNIKDRYYGTNDPVAEKMLRRTNGMYCIDDCNYWMHTGWRSAESATAIEPPEDKSITTLFIGGITADTTEQDLRFVTEVLRVLRSGV